MTLDDFDIEPVQPETRINWTWFAIGVMITFLPSVVSYLLAPAYFLLLNFLFILVGTYVTMVKAPVTVIRTDREKNSQTRTFDRCAKRACCCEGPGGPDQVREKIRRAIETELLGVVYIASARRFEFPKRREEALDLPSQS